jgi:putative transposase
MDWARILAFVTGMVDQELLARNEYLATENRILKARLKGRLKVSDAERATLVEIGDRLGRTVLSEVANVARPDTILAWYRKLVAGKFDGSKAPRSPGRPRIQREVEQLIVRMAKENRDWGYDRTAGVGQSGVYREIGQCRLMADIVAKRFLVLERRTAFLR